MKLGFTGTQEGMQTCQLHELREWVFQNVYDIEEFHHGCCVGADTQAHLLMFDVLSSAYDLESIATVMHYHPPIITDKMSDLREFPGTWHKPAPYPVRNRDIVDACDILFAGPKSNTEAIRSGTWSTVRYARSTGKAVKVLKRWEVKQ